MIDISQKEAASIIASFRTCHVSGSKRGTIPWGSESVAGFPGTNSRRSTPLLLLSLLFLNLASPPDNLIDSLDKSCHIMLVAEIDNILIDSFLFEVSFLSKY